MIIVSYTHPAGDVAAKAVKALRRAGYDDAEAFLTPGLAHHLAVNTTSGKDDHDGAVNIVNQVVARHNREGNSR